MTDPSTKKNASGFTLVELMVATLVVAFLGYLFYTALSTYNLVTKKLEWITTQNQLSADLRRSLLSRDTIVRSIQARGPNGLRANPDLFNCVCGAGSCRSYLNPFLEASMTDASGSTLSPASYDGSGFPCLEANGSCLFRVRTSYFAQCPPAFDMGVQDPRLNCNGSPAEFIAINYVVEPLGNVLTSGEAALTRVSSGWVFIEISQLNFTAGECN